MEAHSFLRNFNTLQKISMSLMGVLMLITFIGTNLQALLWQSSDWLVSTVLPAVVIDLTNEQRVNNSAQVLTRNSALDAAARLKAEHMAKNEYFSHFSPSGVSPWYWSDEAGYVYAHAGENLAIHFTDSSEVVEAWMNSPLHRENIVSGLYSEIGVGTAKGTYEGYDTVYVVQLFGAPAIPPVPATDSGPLVVALDLNVITEPATPNNATVEPIVEVFAEQQQIEVLTISEKTPTDDIASIHNADYAADGVYLLDEETLANESQIPEVQTDLSEVVVLESPIISTSSGLAVAQVSSPVPPHAGATIGSMATRPNDLLEIIYIVLASAVVFLLSASVVMEARRMRFQQVAYGALLLVGMGGLWFAHSLLTTGAVVV